MSDIRDVLGPENLKLTPQFAVRDFQYQHGLRDHLLAACGGQNNYGLAMGDVLHHHRCGCWGPVSNADRALNQHVLHALIIGKPVGQWVVSQHVVAGVALEITSNLDTGETRIRRPTSPSPRLCDEVGE